MQATPIEPREPARRNAMKTIQSLKPTDAVLVGRLYLLRTYRARPGLGISVWCPYCKREHHHSWDESLTRVDQVDHRAAHCNDGPL